MLTKYCLWTEHARVLVWISEAIVLVSSNCPVTSRAEVLGLYPYLLKNFLFSAISSLERECPRKARDRLSILIMACTQ